MAYNLTILGLLFSILFHVSANNNLDTNRRKQRENELKLLKEYEAFQAHVTNTVTSMVKNLLQADSCPEDKDGNGVCQKPTPVSLEGFEHDVNSLLDRTETFQIILLSLLPVVTTLLENEERKANLGRRCVLAELSASVELSCDSKGQPLQLCFWEHSLNGWSRVVNIDDDVSQSDGEGFAVGKCVLRIPAFGANDTGPWGCTLISRNGSKFTGVVNLVTYHDAPEIDDENIDKCIQEVPEGDKTYAEREIRDVSHSNFQFCTALQENLPMDGNLVFSPLSLGTILLMVRFGARGQTGTQIDTALKLPFPIGNMDDLVPLRQGFYRILKKLREASDDYNVTVASRMYVDERVKTDPTFKTISKRVLDIEASQVNFKDGVKAAESINSWIRNETKVKVTELFSPHSFRSSDREIVLANVIYFKSPWKYPFETSSTQKASFHLTDGRNTMVDMMSLEADFPFGNIQELNAKIVVLPYKGDHFSMQVLIPKHTQTLDGLLLALKRTSMDSILKNIQHPGNCEKVQLFFPKLKIESTRDLKEPLEKLGAVDMFSESEADFGGIPRDVTKAPKLFVSHIVQKAFFQVDEDGTEDAAFLGIRVYRPCRVSLITEIKVDRPFYFQVVESETTAVLFAGVVRNPNA